MLRSAMLNAVLFTLVWTQAAPAAGSGPAIDHQSVRCVVANAYPWIEARVASETALAGVKVRFRTPASREWYSVQLADDGEQWSGALPRPTARLATFVYYLEAADTSAHTARTPEATVRVVADEAGCGTQGVGPSVPEASVVVLTPPRRPAVPKGFESSEPESSGSNAKVGVLNLSPRTSLLGALGLGAIATGVALGVSNRVPDAPEVVLLNTAPPPGSTLSLSALDLSLRLRIVPTRDIARGTVVAGLGSAGGSAACLNLWTEHGGMTAGRATEVSLQRVLPFFPCQAPFSVDQAEVVVRGPDETDVFSQNLPLAYSFVP